MTVSPTPPQDDVKSMVYSGEDAFVPSENGAPVRVQLRRTKGWRMPANTVKVDRSTRWGNQIVVGSHRGIGYRLWTAEDAVDVFRSEMEYAISDKASGEPPLDLSPLRGKNLACWCRPGSPCHADVLLELANAPSPSQAGISAPSAEMESKPARQALKGRV